MKRVFLSSCTIFTFFPLIISAAYTNFLGFRSSLDAISVSLGQEWRTSGTRSSLLSQIVISFPWPASPDCTMCVCIVYIYIYIKRERETVYELPLPNSTAVKHFYTNRERCEALTGYLSLGCRAGGHVTLDSTFYNVLSKPEIIAAPGYCDIFFPSSHSSRSLLEI